MSNKTTVKIVAAVSKESGVLETLILSDRRNAPIVYWRNVVFYIAHELCGISLPQIGAEMNRDHSTVLHGVRRAKQQIQGDPTLEKMVRRIAKMATPAAPQDKIADAIMAFRELDNKERQSFLAYVAAGL